MAGLPWELIGGGVLPAGRHSLSLPWWQVSCRGEMGGPPTGWVAEAEGEVHRPFGRRAGPLDGAAAGARVSGCQPEQLRRRSWSFAPRFAL